MRYLMLVVLPKDHVSERGAMPDPEAISRMTKFNEELAKAGVLLALDGLHPTSAGWRIKGGAVTDGPFAETKEVVGGYWIIKVDSPEEALEWARKAPMTDETIELRRIFDMEDFPEESQKAAESNIVRDRLTEVAEA